MSAYRNSPPPWDGSMIKKIKVKVISKNKTGRSILIEAKTTKGIYKKVWLPLSLIARNNQETFKVNKNKEVSMKVPQWLLYKNGLDVGEQVSLKR